MANIELVIKIPEEKLSIIKNKMYCGIYDLNLYNAVANGTQLPKGHGRLLILSEDAVKRELTHLGFSCQSWISDVGLSDATVAIIEADKEESEG